MQIADCKFVKIQIIRKAMGKTIAMKPLQIIYHVLAGLILAVFHHIPCFVKYMKVGWIRIAPGRSHQYGWKFMKAQPERMMAGM